MNKIVAGLGRSEPDGMRSRSIFENPVNPVQSLLLPLVTGPMNIGRYSWPLKLGPRFKFNYFNGGGAKFNENK